MNIQRVNISTMTGIKKAERLHNSGKYEAPIVSRDYKEVIIFVPVKK